MAAVAISALAWSAGVAAQTPPATPPADSEEPIISDSAFEEELPSLDPDLSQPLEPIENFDVPPAPDATTPTTPGTETIADAPVEDSALNEPLAPIAEFDVSTPEATPGEEDEGKVEPIRYTFEVVGLDEVGLTGVFRDLSALEEADGEATNGAMISARADEDVLLAVRLMRSEGYYDGTAVSSIEQIPDQPGRNKVTITAAPGERYAFGQITVTGPQTVPPNLAREALPLETAKPIVAVEVEAAEANVRLRLPQQGYPFAEVGLRDILLDPETHIGDYALPVEPGPRARFGGFTTEGDLAFGAKHVGVLSRFDRGDLYDSRKVDDLREAMIATNLFTTVSAEPVRTGEIAEDGAEYVNILVRQDAGPARSLTGSAGYSTGEGLRVEAAWEHRNFFKPEGAVRVAAILGTQEQALRLQFRRNNFQKRDRALLLQAEAGRRDYAAFEGYTARISGLLSRESTPIWQKRWTYAVGAEVIATNENQIGSPNLNLGDTFFLAGVSAQLGYDRSNSLLDPTKGFRLLARINPETSLRDPTKGYVRNIVEGSYYQPVSDKLVIAARARVGQIYGAEVNELAPSRRLYAGGGGSVRGFGFQELGPKIEVANPKFDPTDPDEKDDPTILIPTGGRSLLEFAIEARYRFGNFGIVPFVDAGRVSPSQVPNSLSGLRLGAGIGGRVYTSFGPLRVDVATPINRQRGEGLVAVYVSIGQAF
jgi:translocation and assembly module TamA